MKEIVFKYDDGRYTITARKFKDGNEDAIGIQWRKDGRVSNQEFRLYRSDAAQVLRAIAEFSEMPWPQGQGVQQ